MLQTLPVQVSLFLVDLAFWGGEGGGGRLDTNESIKSRGSQDI